MPTKNRVMTLTKPPPSNKLLKFRPDDDAYPIILVPENSLDSTVEPEDRHRYLYLIRLDKWNDKSQYPIGQFDMFLGRVCA